ncbi:hypothetical protein [Polluticaenibacter yanchengensis]|uniref:DUF4595 domain-containing protein n=1 Tax=Polluticaenibacter yanchengensis TaxID=3014562 RepID=A0ABT4UGG6_9BACT|nr:hypothetical protein [Chitinophagaceae bacterium LY-5]
MKKLISKILFLALATIVSKNSTAQYYYKSIVQLKQTKQNFESLVKAKVKTVNVTAADAEDKPLENFKIVQRLAGQSKLITVSSAQSSQETVTITEFNQQFYPTKITDSSSFTLSTATYTYNNNGQLTELSSVSIDPTDSNNYSFREKQVFIYSKTGLPEKMYRVKDGVDTIEVRFITDPVENVPAIEEWWSKGRRIEAWYYIFDKNKNLTGVLRKSKKGQLLPDYLFEYNEDGTLNNYTTVTPGTSNYKIFYYKYNDLGLKDGELILNKQKQSEGSIDYEYVL